MRSAHRARRPVIGLSFKMYFGLEQTARWARTVAADCAGHPALRDGLAELFVLPSFPAIPAVAEAFRGTGIGWGAQSSHHLDAGPHTGEVSPNMLAELGCRYVEVGHAERRRDHGETDTLVALKTAAILRHGMAPVLCVGEWDRTDAGSAAVVALAQVDAALADAPPGRVIVAYEPVWSIGAEHPADRTHIVTVIAALRAHLDADDRRPGSAVIYGGSAAPGLLTSLGSDADGIFLGRFAHAPESMAGYLDEVLAVHAARPARRTTG